MDDSDSTNSLLSESSSNGFFSAQSSPSYESNEDVSSDRSSFYLFRMNDVSEDSEVSFGPSPDSARALSPENLTNNSIDSFDPNVAQQFGMWMPFQYNGSYVEPASSLMSQSSFDENLTNQNPRFGSSDSSLDYDNAFNFTSTPKSTSSMDDLVFPDNPKGSISSISEISQAEMNISVALNENRVFLDENKQHDELEVFCEDKRAFGIPNVSKRQKVCKETFIESAMSQKFDHSYNKPTDKMDISVINEDAEACCEDTNVLSRKQELCKRTEPVNNHDLLVMPLILPNLFPPCSEEQDHLKRKSNGNNCSMQLTNDCEAFGNVSLDQHKLDILAKIEDAVVNFLHSIVHDKELAINVPHQPCKESCYFEDNILKSSQKEKAELKKISFNRKASEHKFTIIVNLMSYIHTMLYTNTKCTKRELYYNNPTLMKDQSFVDSALSEISIFLNVPLWELNVLSSSKGLVAGHLQMITEKDEVINCNNNTGTLVPSEVLQLKSIRIDADFVLILEKDTVFKRLLDDGILDKCRSKVVLITAKGYPDINTRLFLKRIRDEYKDLSILALVDGDPFGIDIMFTYRYGSMKMANAVDKLAVPSIIWIGIHPSEISTLNLPAMELTERDVKKIDELLKRPYINQFIMKELKMMKLINLKAEIESLCDISANYLIDNYLPNKMKN